MNQKTCGAVLVLLFTVGVFGAPQWNQDEPYSDVYSSSDALSAAQAYENLDEGN